MFGFRGRQESRAIQGDRPIYWNLIVFAVIGAVFSGIAMWLVPDDDRNEIALLFIGLIGGYAASIKELDLARIEIEKIRARALRTKAIEGDDGDAGNEKPENQQQQS